jgi:hypothetical protein
MLPVASVQVRVWIRKPMQAIAGRVVTVVLQRNHAVRESAHSDARTVRLCAGQRARIC